MNLCLTTHSFCECTTLKIKLLLFLLTYALFAPFTVRFVSDRILCVYKQLQSYLQKEKNWILKSVWLDCRHALAFTMHSHTLTVLLTVHMALFFNLFLNLKRLSHLRLPLETRSVFVC